MTKQVNFPHPTLCNHASKYCKQPKYHNKCKQEKHRYTTLFLLQVKPLISHMRPDPEKVGFQPKGIVHLKRVDFFKLSVLGLALSL